MRLRVDRLLLESMPEGVELEDAVEWALENPQIVRESIVDIARVSIRDPVEVEVEVSPELVSRVEGPARMLGLTVEEYVSRMLNAGCIRYIAVASGYWRMLEVKEELYDFNPEEWRRRLEGMRCEDRIAEAARMSAIESIDEGDYDGARDRIMDMYGAIEADKTVKRWREYLETR